MIKASKIVDMISDKNSIDRIVIAPLPPYKPGSASIDLRLGCWFSTLRPMRHCVLDVVDDQDSVRSEQALTKTHYAGFGDYFVLHPRSFVLGATLEWIRLSANIGGYVTSRSSWGRRGLIIATAIGVHPGFTGCLTLELSNVGEIPIKLYPGMSICNFFMHEVSPPTTHVDHSNLIGKRKPYLNRLESDDYFRSLAQRSPQ